MKITERSEHHSEVTMPDVWATSTAGTLCDLTVELPDHLLDLSIPEAVHLRDMLSAALTAQDRAIKEAIDRILGCDAGSSLERDRIETCQAIEALREALSPNGRDEPRRSEA